MPLVVKDRVKETTTTTGTGTVTLAGPAAGFQSFSVIGNGNTTYYAIVGGTEWEVGIGTYSTTGPTLTRDTVLESSNSGSLVNFSAGAKDVFVTYPAEKAISYDASDNVGIGNTNPAYKLEVTAISTGGNAIGIRGRSSDNIGTLNFSSNDGATAYGKIQGRSTDLRLEATSSNTMTFYTNVTERMRIDSSGNVGIGITTPDVRLRVAAASPTNGIIETVSATGSTGAQINFGQSSVADWVIGQPAGVNAFAFWVNRNISASGTEAMRLDASGNLGLGVTPSAWVLSGYKAFEIGALGNALFSGPNDAWLTTNAYYNGGWKYATTQAAAAYNQNAGTHSWRIAANGTAGTAISFTQAMTLDASGNLGIGTTSPGSSSRIHANAASGSIFTQISSGANNVFLGWDSTGGTGTVQCNSALTFLTGSGYTERMRIDSSGNVGIGTSSPGNKLDIVGAGSSQIRVKDGIGATSYYDFGRDGTDGFFGFSGAQTTFSGYKWSVNAGTEVMRITNGGNLGIGTSSPAYRLDVVAADTTANLGYALRLRHNTTASAATIQFTDNPATVQYDVITSNTSEFTLRSGSTRPFTVWTNGSERLRIGPAGQIGLSGANYGTSGQVLTSNGSGSAPTWQSPSGGANIQEFSASGTWTKPSGAQFVMVECWGAGGGGGSGCRNTSGTGGGGGGGGAYAYRIFKASDLGATVSVTIGAGGTGAAAATGTANGTNGGDGGTTSFGTSVYGYGGGGGQGGTASRGLGGSGGGVLSAAATTTAGQPTSGQFGSTTAIDGASYPAGFGGGTGGACRSGNNAWNGGCSYQGGAGGGGGAVWGGWQGGVGGSRTDATGGGGSAGTWPGSGPNLPGGNGTTFGFGGGGGASGFSSTAGSSGGDGGIAAGGGGGGAGYSGVNGGAGGAGGAGYCRVYSW